MNNRTFLSNGTLNIERRGYVAEESINETGVNIAVP